MTLTFGIRTVVAIVVVSESGLFASSNVGSSSSIDAGELTGVVGEFDRQGFWAGDSALEAVIVVVGCGSGGLWRIGSGASVMGGGDRLITRTAPMPATRMLPSNRT